MIALRSFNVDLLVITRPPPPRFIDCCFPCFSGGGGGGGGAALSRPQALTYPPTQKGPQKKQSGPDRGSLIAPRGGGGGIISGLEVSQLRAVVQK